MAERYGRTRSTHGSEQQPTSPQIVVLTGDQLANAAADVLDATQEQFRYFAKQAGDSLSFGQLGTT
jgi:hypothetical protein